MTEFYKGPNNTFPEGNDPGYVPKIEGTESALPTKAKGDFMLSILAKEGVPRLFDTEAMADPELAKLFELVRNHANSQDE